jgi:hypothetical protein
MFPRFSKINDDWKLKVRHLISDNEGTPDLVLLEMEAWVAANNTHLQGQMIKANRGRSAIFLEGAIATIQIPTKLRLKPRLSGCQYGSLSKKRTGQATKQAW